MSEQTVTSKDAKALAVRYLAFNEACDNKDDEGIWIWGDMLLESQERTGAYLYEAEFLSSCVNRARARDAGQKQQAA